MDANILYSRTLRDWVFMLANATGRRMFRLVSTEDVLVEVEYHLRRNNPRADGATITRIRKLFEEQFDQLLRDYPGDIAYPGSDPNDHHVHTAATACGAQILLTADAGFTRLGDASDLLDYEVFQPDDFLILIDDSDPDAVRAVTLRQAKYWSQRKGSRKLDAALRAAGCPEFAGRISVHLRELCGPAT